MDGERARRCQVKGRNALTLLVFALGLLTTTACISMRGRRQ
jgi:hypothetical protein